MATTNTTAQNETISNAHTVFVDIVDMPTVPGATPNFAGFI
jgi:hypothetical protein